MRKRILLEFLVLPAAVGFAGSLAHATSIPYTQNFDSATVGTSLPGEFTETNNQSAPSGGTGSSDSSIVNVSAGNNVLQQAISGKGGTSAATNINGSAAVDFTGQFPNSAGTSFTLSTTFTFSGLTHGNFDIINTSLAALGTSPDFSSGSSYRLSFTLYASGTGSTSTGGLALTEPGGSGLSTPVVTGSNLSPTPGTVYTMTLSGTYTSATSINLTGSITDGTNTITSTATDTSAETGANFGYRSALQAQVGSTADETIQFDNLSVTPEPASLGLLAVAGLGLLRRRRPGSPRG